MSLEKAIAHGKEKRKPYYKAGKHDKTCRPHGSCPWCEGNRLAKKREQDRLAKKKLQNGGYDERVD